MSKQLEPRIKRVFVFANFDNNLDFLSRQLRNFGLEIKLVRKDFSIGVFICRYQPCDTDLIISTSDLGLYSFDLGFLEKYVKTMNLDFYCIDNRDKLEDDSCYSTGLRFGCPLYRLMRKKQLPNENFLFFMKEKEGRDSILLKHNPDANWITQKQISNGELSNYIN